MRAWLAEFLIDPETKSHLSLSIDSQHDNEIETGVLTSKVSTFSIRGGVPRFTPHFEQAQTQGSFSYKWTRRDSYEFDHYLEMIERDEFPRWGMSSIAEFRQMFHGKDRIVEIGCGSAHFASIYVPHLPRTCEWVGTDLSIAIDVARERLGNLPNASFVQANALQLPYKDKSFDMVFCRGVMHHTPSTYEAFRSLSRIIKPGGEFAFMIYRKMGPIREFTDEFIRNTLSKLPPEEAWGELEALTKFGKLLSDLKVTVDVPEEIKFLNIPAGKHDLQRLIYYHFLKAYWNDALDFDTNQHVTFDWYHPQFASHHTEEEIRTWCDEFELELTFIKELETSWAVRATKL